MNEAGPVKYDQPEATRAAATRALVLGPYLAARARHVAPDPNAPLASALINTRSPDARIAEAAGLARAIDLDVVDATIVTLSQIRPASFLGKGKVEEIAARVKDEALDLVFMDCALSPVQQRNLEKEFGAKVIDRTGLILEIFGRRARTREGALQVELAHLAYQKSRLVRSWTHLERQRGGFGFLGGPGETQIETDRRLISERMVKIEGELDRVKRTRSLHRKTRRDVPYPIVALVGYTNAGKSTLFNRLTQATVMAEDMLFATLDPTLRIVKLPHGSKVLLSDTVGFISDLPTMLISAFRATLEEVLEADVVLHIRDIAHEDTDAQSADVEAILGDLGVNPKDHHRLLEVWNKLDLLDPEAAESLANAAKWRDAEARPVIVSALTGQGERHLLDEIEMRLAEGRSLFAIDLDPADGQGLNWLYEHTEVMERSASDDGVSHLVVRALPERSGQILQRFHGARNVGPIAAAAESAPYRP
ncbi:GTPase HflX [Beijerinckia sp. L45]|uniref:GTPase HflX n=1 Tax=Beijerinckia sp. L45 TaxID=1641855 RepID=UPI00131E701C|nr:GTPase HflX [Beijerinckia sp. L45]